MTHSSWTKCQDCQSLQANKLFPSYRKRPVVKPVKNCGCSRNRYIVPKIDEIPIVLRNLSHVEIIALRPLDVHLGDYAVERCGYRMKGGMFRLTWSKKSVLEKIAQLDVDSRRRCEAAYQFLIASDDSAYSSFVAKRDFAVRRNDKFSSPLLVRNRSRW